MDDARWAAMTSTDTPNAGRCWWGWGLVSELKKVPFLAGGLAVQPLTVSEAALQMPNSRISLTSLPLELQSICTDHPFERLLHSRGRDFLDVVDCAHGVPHNLVDLVAFPRSEKEIFAIFDFCSTKRIAVIPFGGGSSVVFGVNPPASSEGYSATLTVDMLYFDRIVRIDEESLTARVQGGIKGPELERQLKATGLTLRYFPQSFEFSTVGGWVATRGGGHFATGPTHIDDMVESVRMVTPAGVTIETRQLPGSGAGPAEHRLYLGSEGTLGIITEVCLRLLRIPTRRSQTTVLFRASSDDEAFLKGARAVQQISQSGLQPANLRLVYGPEVARTAPDPSLDLNNAAVLLIGFEAANDAQDLAHQMSAALKICSAFDGAALQDKEDLSKLSTDSSRKTERSGLASKWGAGFMRGGYMLSAGAVSGIVLNTFETAVTWDRFFECFHAGVLESTRSAILKHCGSGTVTCRLTHVYPDGPAPYYTVLAEGCMTPEDNRSEQWRQVKQEAMDAVMRLGGTSTHHHAVGKLHRPHYHSEIGSLFRSSLEAVKRVHDPAWVLNPGVLLEVPPKARL